jgi:hypothetical protein
MELFSSVPRNAALGAVVGHITLIEPVAQTDDGTAAENPFATPGRGTSVL